MTIPTTVSPVTGCDSTPALTTDEEIVPSVRVTETTTSPWSPATSRLKSSMFAMTPFNSPAEATARSALTQRPAAPGAAMITKDSYTYSIKILRQEKTLRDHVNATGLRMWSGVIRMRWGTRSILGQADVGGWLGRSGRRPGVVRPAAE